MSSCFSDVSGLGVVLCLEDSWRGVVLLEELRLDDDRSVFSKAFPEKLFLEVSRTVPF